MMLLSLICCGEERKWTDIWSHLPLQHRVWLRSLCQVNGHWQMLGSGPSSLILALEGVLVEFSTCLRPDIEICMHMHSVAPEPLMQCGILQRLSLQVQIWHLLWFAWEAGSEHQAPLCAPSSVDISRKTFQLWFFPAGWRDIFLPALETVILLIPIPVVQVCILFCC